MSLLSWIYAPGEQARGEELDRQLAELNRQRLESGFYTPEVYAQAMDNLSAGNVDVEKELSGAFTEGWKEGGDNVRRTVGDAINSTVATVGRIIPWQIWLILGCIALFYAWPIIGPGITRRLKAVFA
jgi:hypothetical protein